MIKRHDALKMDEVSSYSLHNFTRRMVTYLIVSFIASIKSIEKKIKII